MSNTSKILLLQYYVIGSLKTFFHNWSIMYLNNESKLKMHPSVYISQQPEMSSLHDFSDLLSSFNVELNELANENEDDVEFFLKRTYPNEHDDINRYIKCWRLLSKDAKVLFHAKIPLSSDPDRIKDMQTFINDSRSLKLGGFPDIPTRLDSFNSLRATLIDFVAELPAKRSKEHG